MLVYTHPECLGHDPGPGHPECPARLAAVTEALRAGLPALEWREAPLAERSRIEAVHDAALVARVLGAEGRPLRIDADTMMSPGSTRAALRACGAGIAAVDAVLAGETRRAFCAVRPPGHHATADTAMGFCLFNAIAVAARHALDRRGLARVAIVDFDVHHGNGTQAIFEHEPRVLYLGSHQHPLYPGTGEPGDGQLHAHHANAALAPGEGSVPFRRAWSETLLPALEAFAPELVMVSAGFDGHRLDPLADLCLEADDYRWLSQQLAACADRHARGRLVSLLEGGYSLAALRECSVAHLAGLGD